MCPSTQGTSFLVILQQVRLVQDNIFHILTTRFTGSLRSFSIIETLGSGSFGSVFLCDWHSNLPHSAPPPSPTHIPDVARPGTHLVAVKKLKRRLEHGWDACHSLKELKVQCISQPPKRALKPTTGTTCITPAPMHHPPLRRLPLQ
jgi:hypothetical protein